MAKSSGEYWRKLKDPRWQRKRLEALELAKWQCENCGSGEDTLNVHHYRYVKGREPWEYSTGELGVLCEDCHKEWHWGESRVKEILAGQQMLEAFALLGGFYQFNDNLDPGVIEESRQCGGLTHLMGELAHFADGLDEHELISAIKFVVNMHTAGAEARAEACEKGYVK